MAPAREAHAAPRRGSEMTPTDAWPGGFDIAGLKARWVDVAMVAVLAVSVFTGLLRGLVFEVLSLAGWLAAYVTAQWATPLLAPHLPVGVPGSALSEAAAFVSAFVAVLVLWALLTRLVRWLVRASPLNALDRLFGGAFGLLRGGLVLLVVTTVVGLLPLRQSAAWRQSHGAVWLNTALHGLKPLLPAEVSRHLPV